MFSFLQITSAERHLRLRQDGRGGRGRGVGEGVVAVLAIVRGPAGPVRRGRVRRRGAVGGRPGAGTGAAVAGQRREQGVLAKALGLQLQLKVLADLVRESLVLLLQGPLQLSLELQREVSWELGTCTKQNCAKT